MTMVEPVVEEACHSLFADAPSSVDFTILRKRLVPDALQHLPATLTILLTSGLLPAAVIVVGLNLLLPEDNGA